MAVEDDKEEKSEALEEMKDPEDAPEQEDDDGLPPEKTPPNKALIAVLSLAVFFALFMLFKGEDEPPQQVAVEDPSITIPAPEENQSVISLPREEAFEGAIIEEPPAGEILIESDERQIEPIAPSEAPAVSIPEKELAFFEALKKNKENRPATPEQDAQLSQKAEITPPGPIQKPTPPPKPVVKTTPKPKPKKVVKSKKVEASPDFPFTIQLGAFKSESMASTLSARLKKSGYDAYILAVRSDLFRVRVGVFSSRSEAKALAKQIKSSDRLDSFIVKR